MYFSHKCSVLCVGYAYEGLFVGVVSISLEEYDFFRSYRF